MRILSSIRSYKNLGFVSLALLFAVGGVYSHKLFSFLMPLLTLIVIHIQGGIRKVTLPVSAPVVILLLLLLAVGVSFFWAESPIAALKTFIGAGATFIFAFLLIACLEKASPELISKAYTLVKISGLFFIILLGVQVLSGNLHVAFFKKYAADVYIKPTGSIIGLLIFVGCGFLWVKKNRWVSIFTFILLLFFIYLTKCKTALYGTIFASSIFVLSYAMPFWITRIAMFSSYTFLLLSPFFYIYLFPPSQVNKLSSLNWLINFSLLNRIFAWEFYAKKFLEKPFSGWGAESARYLSNTPELAPGIPHVIHPHNNSIQAYVELGIAGGILYALFFASLFWLVEKHVRDRLSVAVCNATLVFGFVAAEITHNIWRNYWLALVALTAGLIILFLKVREEQLHVEGGH